MLLSDLFNQLTYGELAQLSIGGASKGGIQEKDYPAMISHVNLALTALHTRFPLKEKQLTVQQFANVTTYVLSSEYAVSNTDSIQPYKWIVDTTLAPFTDDIIRIDAAYDELGVAVPLNDLNADNSWFTNAYNQLLVPMPEEENTGFLIYRANHVSIPIATTDAASIDLDIPPTMHEPLSFYVASRVFASTSGDTAMQQSMYYKQMYEAACAALDNTNALNASESSTNVKLENNGWV